MNTIINTRSFDILAFISRNGSLHRMSREFHQYDVSETVSGQIIRRTASQVAMGRSVIVLESGAIKPDWSRVTHLGLRGLITCTENDYVRFIREVQSLKGLSRIDFLRHVERSFPGRLPKSLSVM